MGLIIRDYTITLLANFQQPALRESITAFFLIEVQPLYFPNLWPSVLQSQGSNRFIYRFIPGVQSNTRAFQQPYEVG